MISDPSNYNQVPIFLMFVVLTDHLKGRVEFHFFDKEEWKMFSKENTSNVFIILTLS